MLIDRVFPAVIAEKGSLRERLAAAGGAMGLTNDQVNAILAIVPEKLIGAGCFLDKMTGLWRYEFGVPYEIGEDFVWGTHMWVPVDCLLSALLCSYSRLQEEKRTAYLRRLADADAHHTALVEMIPGHKVNSDIAAEFEVAGLGVGNTTVDLGHQTSRQSPRDNGREETNDRFHQAGRVYGRRGRGAQA